MDKDIDPGGLAFVITSVQMLIFYWRWHKLFILIKSSNNAYLHAMPFPQASVACEVVLWLPFRNKLELSSAKSDYVRLSIFFIDLYVNISISHCLPFTYIYNRYIGSILKYIFIIAYLVNDSERHSLVSNSSRTWTAFTLLRNFNNFLTGQIHFLYIHNLPHYI